jgi:hypothetical protein
MSGNADAEEWFQLHDNGLVSELPERAAGIAAMASR